jgi:mono/diheme cytochrome c family protein
MRYNNRSRVVTFLFIFSGLLILIGCQTESAAPSDVNAKPHIIADNPVEAGRYLTIVAGCNDCHTDGYLQTDGNVPEEDWLAGSMLGWRGPWGTTYASNLRVLVQGLTEDEWVSILNTRKALPPMPWMNVNKMSDKDARAMYAYIKSLGTKGEKMPSPVPPNVEPKTPYISLAPENLPQAQ